MGEGRIARPASGLDPVDRGGVDGPAGVDVERLSRLAGQPPLLPGHVISVTEGLVHGRLSQLAEQPDEGLQVDHDVVGYQQQLGDGECL